MLKSLKAALVAGSITLVGFTSIQETAQNPVLKTVILDPGHGGKDSGCKGAISKEKDVVLDIALKLARKIKTEYPDVRVVMTRKTDVFIELNQRANIANKYKADLFISIHCNATPKTDSPVNGTETFTMGLHKTDENLAVAKRENSVILQEKNYQETYKDFNPSSPLAYIKLATRQNAYMSSSISLASKIEKYFKGNGQRNSRGVKQAGFLVLWQTNMPSVLIETGFLSNKAEEKFLNTEDGQNTIAESVFKAFKDYKVDLEEQ